MFKQMLSYGLLTFLLIGCSYAQLDRYGVAYQTVYVPSTGEKVLSIVDSGAAFTVLPESMVAGKFPELGEQRIVYADGRGDTRMVYRVDTIRVGQCSLNDVPVIGGRSGMGLIGTRELGRLGVAIGNGTVRLGCPL